MNLEEYFVCPNCGGNLKQRDACLVADCQVCELVWTREDLLKINPESRGIREGKKSKIR